MAYIVAPLVPETNRVLVCGGRNYDDVERVFHVLDSLHRARPIERIIQGGAGGADLLARAWAISRAIPKTTFLADWDAFGKAAGPRRNQRMIDEGKPDLVVAFAGGRGTADMLRRAKAADISWMHDGFTASGREARQGGNEVPCEARQPDGEAGTP